MKIIDEMQLIRAQSKIGEFTIEYSFNATLDGKKKTMSARINKGENNTIGSSSWEKNGSFSISFYKETTFEDIQNITKLVFSDIQELVK